jgi:hypothetical protein
LVGDEQLDDFVGDERLEVFVGDLRLPEGGGGGGIMANDGRGVTS